MSGTTKSGSTPKLKQASLLSFFTKKSTTTSSSTKLKSSDVTTTTTTTITKELPTPTSSSPLKSHSKPASFSGSSYISRKEDKENKAPLQSQPQGLKTPQSVKKNSTKVKKDFLPSSPIIKKRSQIDEGDDQGDNDDEENISFTTQKKKRKTNVPLFVDDEDEDSFEESEDNDEDIDDANDDDFEMGSSDVEVEAEDDDDEESHVSDEEDVKDIVKELEGHDIPAEDDDFDFGDDDDEIIALAELGVEKNSTPPRSSKSKSSTKVIPENSIESSSFTNTPNSSLSSRLNAFTSFSSSSSVNSTSTPTRTSIKSNITTSSPASKKNFTKENEERYKWLIDIRDADGRSETDPEYDPRSLYIPNSAWAKFTAFEKQYWEIKSKMWDSVVFFKKGKFYELYEKDADIAHNKFDLKLAGGGRANMRLAGIPEMSFEYWAKRFIDEGYKVAKVDQKESMLAKEIREKGKTTTKEEKVIKRELSCVLTCGTLTDEAMLSDEMSKYCLSLKEITELDGSKIFGVCFVDTATGSIQLTQFNDDPECSKLETLLAQVKPMELILEKNKISSLVMRIIRFNSQPNAIFNFLKSKDEFWDEDTTFEQLTRGKYFKAEDLDDLSNYPSILKNYHEDETKKIGFQSFGALLWYLKSLKLDESIISMGKIDSYDPYKSNFSNSIMRLDGITLQNLEIFSNTFDQTDKGTLFKLLNRAITPFGKRLFKQWVTHPLMNKDKIKERLDSVEALINNGDLMYLLENTLTKLPDLERSLARIHSGNLKVKEFARVVEGFENIKKLIDSLNREFGDDFSSIGKSLEKSIKKIPIELNELVDQWLNAFDLHKAYTENIMIPERGVELEFDESNDNITRLENELDNMLRNYRKEYKSQEICYKDSGKEIYLIEVPIKVVNKIPKDWQQMAATSKCKRYWSPENKKLVRELMEARELHKILTETIQLKMYQKFDENYLQWFKIVSSISEIDCIISLARSSQSLGSPICRPEFIEPNNSNGSAELEFKQLRHPCFISGVNGGAISDTKDFIPNDVSLGVNNKNHIGLLTGANAAGKSTLLRMTCVAVIMAQIGCFLPCESSRLTTIDTIMTRLGANDNIMQGKSTFFVELNETKRMLEQATPRSLLILDELGRGGSSSDGFAIAESVLHHISMHIQSIGFFATHYGNLGNSFKNDPRIIPLRMGILVDELNKKLTFLYKLEEGKSNGSFGMHVASMCGVAREIVDNAEKAAIEWEHTSRLSKKTDEIIEDLVPLGLQSDLSWLINKDEFADGVVNYTEEMKLNALQNMFNIIEKL